MGGDWAGPLRFLFLLRITVLLLPQQQQSLSVSLGACFGWHRRWRGDYLKLSDSDNIHGSN